MFTTKETKIVTQLFPFRVRNVSNVYNADDLVPSRSKDGFVQLQVVQEALRRAVEDGNERLSISSFASLYDVDVEIVVELLGNSFQNIVWSRSENEVFPRSEQHRLKEMLLSSSHDQFIEVDKFLLKHDIQDASLAVINEPLLIKETVDHDGKRYMHSVQLSGKIERYIKGRLSLAEQDASITKLIPADLPGHPPLALIFNIVKELSGVAESRGKQEMTDSEVTFIPSSYQQKELANQLAEVRNGEKLYIDAKPFMPETHKERIEFVKQQLLRDIDFKVIRLVSQKIVSGRLLRKMVQTSKEQLVDTGYAHMPLSEACQEVSLDLHNIIVLELSQKFKQSMFRYAHPYVICNDWLDGKKEELAGVLDSMLKERWDTAPPLESLDDPPTAQELVWNCPVFANMPFGLLTYLLSTHFKGMQNWHTFKLRCLQREADYTFNAFWLQQITATIEVYIEALLTIKDTKILDQLCTALAVFIHVKLVPKVIEKAYARRFVRRISLANELDKLQRDLRQRLPALLSSLSSSGLRPSLGELFLSRSGNPFNYYLKIILYRIWKFSTLFNIPFLEPGRIYELRRHAQSNSHLNAPQFDAELPFQSEISFTYTEARKNAVFEDLRHSMVDEMDDARLYLAMLIILFARRHKVILYATGKAVPKLLKELLEPEVKASSEETGKAIKDDGQRNERALALEDNITKTFDRSINGSGTDPKMNIDSTNGDADVSNADNRSGSENQNQNSVTDANKNSSSTETKHTSENSVPENEAETTQREEEEKEENIIPFNSAQLPLLAKQGICFELGFDINSSPSSCIHTRLYELKVKVKEKTITPADRLWMKAMAGVVDYSNGNVILNGHRNQKGEWVRYRGNGMGHDCDEEELMEIRRWVRGVSEKIAEHDHNEPHHWIALDLSGSDVNDA